MNRICVVHLVRWCNPLSAMEDFVASYCECEAGIDHDLLVLFKGFTNESQLAGSRAVLSGVRFSEHHVGDEGVDINAYHSAFLSYMHRYDAFCFMNSYSKIMVSGWLKAFCENMNARGVGLIGATGSWQSVTSDLEFKNATYGRSLTRLGALLLRPILLVRRLNRMPYFPSYPNPHIRTNAFFVSTDVFASVKIGRIRSKMDAYRFESGKQSITRQIVDLGYRPLVVGRNGQGYEIADWWRSNTFWREKQENLLVADNQTKTYAKGSLNLKIYYSFHAWQDKAYPNIWQSIDESY